MTRRSGPCLVIYAIENNLSLSNMDFYDYTSAAAQQGGVFRGFRR
jgi:hypothetical protein